MNSNFSNLSLRITKQLSKTDKKNNGIYFTPKNIIELLFQHIPDQEFQHILEPSCGSCEFVKYMDENFNNVSIDAIEFVEEIYTTIQNELTFQNQVQLIHHDFLLFDSTKKYDLIIGNPPYFVIQKNRVPDKYQHMVSGRPNIFCIFILHALSLLQDNGILCFVIPSSFLNSSYYSNIRNHLISCGNILHILDFHSMDGFLETSQPTIGFIFQKTTHLQPICKYSMKLGTDTIFTTNLQKLQNIFENSTTLSKLGCIVKTGTVVWNEHKDILTDDPDQTLLIYNSNVSKLNTLEIKNFSNDEKKQYIHSIGSNSPKILVNRGNGNAQYKFQYLFMDGSRPFLVENHLNMICLKDNNQDQTLFNKILQSFQDPRTTEFIQTFLGNNALSKTELETIFPIYL